MIPAYNRLIHKFCGQKDGMILQIALDTPLRRVFDYRPPANWVDPPSHPTPCLGARVRVPFGRQRLIGILVGIAAESAIALPKLKAALEILDRRPLSTCYLRPAALGGRVLPHPPGEVFAAALPAGLRAGQPAQGVTPWSGP